MKILHLSTQDTSGGGGSFSASFRLHKNMINSGLYSRMVVLNKVSNDSTVISISSSAFNILHKILFYFRKIKRKLNIKIFHVSPYFYTEQNKLYSAEKILQRLQFKPDVIIAHWIADFISPETLYELNRRTSAPIVWYFLDMAPLTSGCHYTFGCDGYTKQCGYCPQLGNKKSANDISYYQWKQKHTNIQNTNITAVLASSWQNKMFQASTIFQGKSSVTIPLGLDDKVFCPREKSTARKTLNLPMSRKIILFGALSISEERKGSNYLINSLNYLYEMLKEKTKLRDNILLVSIGKNLNPDVQNIGFDHISIGYLKDDATLASAYQAADIFLCPSIEDAGPMMINESILCGTPVVSFSMGIAFDLVQSGETGYRAKLKDSLDMANGLLELLSLDDTSFNIIQENCRELGIKTCSSALQVNNFSSLCEKLVKNSAKIGV